MFGFNLAAVCHTIKINNFEQFSESLKQLQIYLLLRPKE